MNGFKTPDPKMAAVIVGVLLALFAFSYVAPVLSFPWLRADVPFDPALQQNLLLLLTLGVGYYIGTTRSSDVKNETIATQAATAAAAIGAGGPLNGATPAGTPDDPIAVTETSGKDNELETFRALVRKTNPDVTDAEIEEAWAALLASRRVDIPT